jgi:hypothetical protein
MSRESHIHRRGIIQPASQDLGLASKDLVLT